MTDQTGAAPMTAAVSPYLSLRQSVRPLIFAYSQLAREQDRSGELAAECTRLAELTQELLEAAALTHLLAPRDAGEVDGASKEPGRSELVAAYATVGMLWAEVVGGAMALADILIDESRFSDVHRLADFLRAAGEPAAGQDLRSRADAAALQAAQFRLAGIHPAMTEPEIAAAIDALRDSTSPEAVSFYLRDLATAILGIAPRSWREDVIRDIHASVAQARWDVGEKQHVRKKQRLGFIATEHGVLEIQLPYSAIVDQTCVAGPFRERGAVKLVSVIRLPEPLADELERDRSSTKRVFERFDALARTFQQIQAENERT